MDTTETPAPDANNDSMPDAAPGRWDLVRDIAVFQVKLVVDGLRDLVLVPVSLVTGLISLLKSGDRPGTEFYDLLRYGRRSDRLINLFGAVDRVHGQQDDDEPMPDIDEMVEKVEAFVVDEYRKGGMTAQAKRRVDQLIDALRGTDDPATSTGEQRGPG